MRIFSTLIGTLICSFPAAEYVQHGLDPKTWPHEALSPSVWFSSFTTHPNLGQVAGAYWDIVTRQSPASANGGWSLGPLLAFSPLALAVLLRFAPKPPMAKRDVAGTFGAARFAIAGECAAMTRGLELGIDPVTGRAVRIAAEGTLVTLAPPRTGKTSGLLIPNLSYPELGAWAGPAVVLDSKGEVYRADRRRLVRSLVGKEPPRRAIPTGTASRWALIRSRLAYRKTALASAGFMLAVLLTGILMARANTPLGMVVSNASQDWSVPFKLKDGQVAFDRLEAGRSYALVRRDGGGDVLRCWAPRAGYAEAHITAGYVHEAPGGLVTPPAAEPPAGW